MTVLAHLGHEHPWLSTSAIPKVRYGLCELSEFLVVFIGLGVDTRQQGGLRLVALKHRFHSVGDLADGGPCSCGLHTGGQQVPVANSGLRDSRQCGLTGTGVSLRPDLFEASHLLLANLGVVDVEHVDRIRVVGHVLVHPDDRVLAAIDAHLAQCSGFFDA